MINLLIADDHQLVIDGLKLMLEDAADMQCIAEANTGIEVLQRLNQIKVDVLLLDINMPEMNGLDCCKRVTAEYPEVKIIILSMLQEANIIKQMLQLGAKGYLLKNAGQEEVLKAIRYIHQGKTFYGEGVMDIVMSSFSQPTEVKKTPAALPSLSRREKQVLKLIVNEYTTAEIAKELFISFGTVETHRRNLLAKLKARNTAGLVRIALEYSLL